MILNDRVPPRGVAIERQDVFRRRPAVFQPAIAGKLAMRSSPIVAMVLLHRAALRVQRDVAPALNGPFVILFEEQSADETAYGLIILENADDVGSAFDLADGALDRIQSLLSPDA